MASRRGYWAENSFAITCAADDEDVQAHNADRLYLCKHLAGVLYERFKSGLSDPIVMALSVLNHKWWPDVVLKQDKPDFLQLDLFGLREISLIIESYKKFVADVTGKSRSLTSGRLSSVWLCKSLRSWACRSSDCGHAC